MATNHTEHYELSQWLSDDYVVREDFNDDNLKIDTALNGIAEELAAAGKLKLLYSASSAPAFSITVPFFFGDIDFSGYKILIADVNVTTESSGSLSFSLNNLAGSHAAWGSTEVSSTCGTICKESGKVNRIILFSPFGGDYPISFLNFPSGGLPECGYSPATFSTLASLVVSATNPLVHFESGSSLKLWGIE